MISCLMEQYSRNVGKLEVSSDTYIASKSAVEWTVHNSRIKNRYEVSGTH